MGQTKAGKSSLINAILGDQQAKTDILPATSEVARYRLDWDETDDHLTLLDTVGYATDGATKKQLEETKQALREADLVLFVMNANSPAREPDREMLATLRTWFEIRKELKPVPVLGVLTHIDLLSPVMEWSPPYDWRSGGRPKEVNIREAVSLQRRTVRQHAGRRGSGVCRRGPQAGIRRGRVPAARDDAAVGQRPRLFAAQDVAHGTEKTPRGAIGQTILESRQIPGPSRPAHTGRMAPPAEEVDEIESPSVYQPGESTKAKRTCECRGHSQARVSGR